MPTHISRWIISALLPAILAVALTALLRAAPPPLVDLGAPGDSRFIWGFYDGEAADGASFRWSGPQARLLLHGATSGPAELRLRLSGERLVAQGLPTVRLVGAAAYGSFDVVPGWRVYRVLLPPGAAAGPAGEARPLALRTGVSVPGNAEEGRDYRALGAPVDWALLAPLGGAPEGALPRALGLAWALALLGVAAARLDAALLGRSAGRPLRVGLLLGAAAAALLAWAARDPYGLAWALPTPAWALGLASALLAAGPLLAARLWAAPALARPWPALAGLSLLAVAQGLLNTQQLIGPAIVLALLGLLLLCAGPGGLGAGLWAPAADLPRRLALALLGLALLLALALRLYRIDTLPFGLWRDEARHGLTALRMAADPTYRPAYVLDLRVELPGLGLAPFALSLQLLGVHIWTMRLVTALAGALTVLPVYGLACRLSGRRAVGLLAALLVAASSWQISISRFSFPTVFEPLLTWSGLWLLDRALRPPAGRPPRPAQTALDGLLAGACFGLAAQTYHTGRFSPLLGGLLALAALRGRPGWRPWLLATLPAALGCLLVLGPLIGYALRQPDGFNGRIGAVFVLGEEARQGRAPLAVLDESLRRHLLMFNVQGDLNGRHHAPGRPMLDYLTGLAFLAGAAALLRRPGDWRSQLLLAALGVGLLPSFLAVDAPHAMRAFGAAPLACLIAALGAAELARAMRPAWGRRLPSAWAVAPLIATLIGLNAWVYFVIMPPDREVFLGFYPVQSRMGVYVREGAGTTGGRVYVPRGVAADQIFAFLTAGLPVETFDGAALSSPPRPGDRFLLSGYLAEQQAEAAALAAYLGPDPRPVAAGPGFPDGGGPTFVIYATP